MTEQPTSCSKGVCTSREASPGETTYLVVGLGKRCYAVDTRFVRVVLNRGPSAVLRTAGRSVSGVVFYRGTCVTLLDLGWKLTGTPVGSSSSRRIVVLREPAWAGLLVDSALALASASMENTADPRQRVGRDARYVLGTIAWNKRSVAVLDVRGVIASEAFGGRQGSETLPSAATGGRPDAVAY